jgi:3alpha(or 20beta)-hydroxysteroid dehydrogenase
VTRRLDGHVVLITGAGSGIGAATAATAARDGARVVLGDVNTAQAGAVAGSIGDQAMSCHLDVADEASWASFVDGALSRHGRIDGLVNCAAIATGHSLVETSAEEITRVLAVNTVGPFLGIKAALAALRRSETASVVNIASCAALAGLRANIAYSTSKFGVRGLTKALVHELGSYGIRVNSVFPGYIDTPMSRPEWTDYSAAGSQHAEVALGRTGRPEEISGLVCFLLSAEASYCTGSEFVADGGLTSVVPGREVTSTAPRRPAAPPR